MLHTNERIIKNKVGLINLAEELQNISKACKVMGLSRETFYRYKRAVEEGGVESLMDKTRRKPNLLNRVDDGIEKAVLVHAIEFPAQGQTRTSNELRKKGIFISPSGARSIWLRHNLESFKKRLSALEKKSAEVLSLITNGLYLSYNSYNSIILNGVTLALELNLFDNFIHLMNIAMLVTEGNRESENNGFFSYFSLRT